MGTDSGTAQTRQRLLTAAAEEILERGYAGASLSRIGDRIGLTKGALGHHFPTKSSLVDALTDYVVAMMPAIATRTTAAFPTSPIRTCVAVMGAVASMTRLDPVFGAAIFAFQDPAIDPARVAPLRTAVGDLFDGCLQGAITTESYTLAMPIEDAVEFLHVILAGFLSSARFPDSARPHHEPEFMKATLAGIGIGDADAVVDDVMRTLLSA